MDVLEAFLKMAVSLGPSPSSCLPSLWKTGNKGRANCKQSTSQVKDATKYKEWCEHCKP